MLTPVEARSIAGWKAERPLVPFAVLMVGVLLGAVAFGLAMASPPPAPQRAWQALFVNLLFFAGWAQASVVFSAVMRLTRARWGMPLVRLAESGVVFALAAPFGLVLLFAGREHVMPWLAHPPELGGWLDFRWVVGRELLAWGGIAVAAAAFVGAALRRDLGDLDWGGRGRLERWLTRRWRGQKAEIERSGRRLDVLAAILALAYALGLSLTAFDLIMPLEPRWRSALLGGHFFVSTLYLGVAGLVLALAAAVKPLKLGRALDPDRMQDLGKLLSGLALFTTYLFFSQFLPIWYANLPDEVSFLVPRIYADPWRKLAWGVLGAAYLGPFVLLLPADMKRRLPTLGVAALLAAAGLWLERFLLIAPTLSSGHLYWGVVESGVTLGFLSAFAASALLFLRRFPVLPVADPRLYELQSTGP